MRIATKEGAFDIYPNMKDSDQPAKRSDYSLSYTSKFSIVSDNKRRMKVLIRLRGCAARYGPLLSAYARRHRSHGSAYLFDEV